MHRRAEIQGLPICRRSGNAEWRRNSDHSTDAGILLRRGAAKASGEDSEAGLQAEREAQCKGGQSLAESGVGKVERVGRRRLALCAHRRGGRNEARRSIHVEPVDRGADIAGIAARKAIVDQSPIAIADGERRA